jgi:hypothetical protein
MIKLLFIKLIRFYQKYISKKTCLYKPCCSEYTLEAIHIHGVIIGGLLGVYRILRCNPFSHGGFDPVPEKYFKVRWVL